MKDSEVGQGIKNAMFELFGVLSGHHICEIMRELGFVRVYYTKESERLIDFAFRMSVRNEYSGQERALKKMISFLEKGPEGITVGEFMKNPSEILRWRGIGKKTLETIQSVIEKEII